MGLSSRLQSHELIKISLEHKDKIDKLCQYPRDNFSIRDISYTAILPTGNYFVISSNTDYLAEYLSSDCYKACPFLNSGDKKSVPQVYMPFLKIEAGNPQLLRQQELCEKHGLYQPIVFSVVKDNIQETFTFFSEINSVEAVNLYLNSVNKLQGYTTAFKKDISHIIEQYAPELPLAFNLLLAERTPSIFKEITSHLNTSDAVNNSVDQLIKVVPKLTFREAQVLQFYLEYRSAKEIARYTDLSTRTVEKHIENFKKKIGLRKKELILEKVNHLLADV